MTSNQDAPRKLHWTTARIRNLVNEALTDGDIDEICQACFKPVFDNFTSGMERKRKITLMIEYCDRQIKFGRLLIEIEKRNPNQYQRSAKFLKRQQVADNARWRSPYVGTYFVDRKKILAKLKKAIDGAIKHSLPIKRAVRLYGISGIGKSWLVRRFTQQYGCLLPTKTRRGTCSLVFDFDILTTERITSRAELLSLLIKKIYEMLSRTAEIDGSIRSRISDEDLKTPSSTRPQDIMALLQIPTERFVPICVFDSIDVLEQERPNWYAWFVDEIWLPLADQKNTMMILVSRQQRMEMHDLQRSMFDVWKLAPFDSMEVTDFIGRCVPNVDVERVSREFFSYSHGHPGAIRRLTSSMNGAGSTPMASLLGDVVTSWLDPFAQDIREYITLASALRRFDIEHLRSFLARHDEGASLESKPLSYFIRVVDSLLATGLVNWSVTSHYCVDPTVRSVISIWLSQEKPYSHRLRDQLAEDFYLKRLQESPELDPTDVIEATFHVISVGRSQSDDDEILWNELETKLSPFLRPARYDRLSIGRLHKFLKSDKELQQLLGSLFFKLEQWIASVRSQVT
ncbi:MAG: hypothetical protein WAW03_11060 [Anaerolineae bacterium]